MDRPAKLVFGNRLAGVQRIADHIEDAAEGVRPDRYGNRAAGVFGGRAAAEAFCRVEREAADPVVAEVLLHLGDQGFAVHVDVDGVEQRGQIARRKLNVDDGADHATYGA